MASVSEPARTTPVAAACDVLVAGGGPAGVAAALAAARAGARVVLLEHHGCLGGVWTAGSLCMIIDHENKPGIMRELLEDLASRGARGQRLDGRLNASYDVEAMKLLLEEKLLAAGVQVQLHTRVVAALGSDAGRLTHVVTESKSGREAWAATVCIDCTGEGDLAAQAGCGFDIGHPVSGQTQPMSLMALLAGVEPVALKPFIWEGEGTWAEPKDRLRAVMESQGQSPSYGFPTFFRLPGGLLCLMANHEYGVRGIAADDVTRATLQARAEVNRLVAALRRSGPPFERLQLVATGSQIGVREGRRVHGLYTVTKDDLLRGARFADAVCRVTFGVDIHATDPAQSKGLGDDGVKVQPYDIPLRALVARDVDGLLLAGRCISGDFWAHASYRVTGNAVALGEAAGRFAADCVREGQTPHTRVAATCGRPTGLDDNG